MKTQSAKAKGRKLQQWVRTQLIEQLDVHPEDIESRSMGAGGEDLIMARAARQKFLLQGREQQIQCHTKRNYFKNAIYFRQKSLSKNAL